MTKAEVIDDLTERIVSGDLAPGEWLVERELSTRYGLSRTPVREVLRDLRNSSLVELQASKGYQVKQLSVKEVIDIFNGREALEGEAARLACLTDSEEFVPKVHELKERLQDVTTGVQSVRVGREIHDLVVETANNRYLTEFYGKLRNLASLTRNLTKKYSGIEDKSKNDHFEILEALSERNAEDSERVMKEHLRSTLKLVLRTLVDGDYL